MGLLSLPGPASNSLLSNSDFWTIVLRKIFRADTPKNIVTHEGRKQDRMPCACRCLINYLHQFKKHGVKVRFSTSGEKWVWDIRLEVLPWESPTKWASWCLLEYLPLLKDNLSIYIFECTKFQLLPEIKDCKIIFT